MLDITGQSLSIVTVHQFEPVSASLCCVRAGLPDFRQGERGLSQCSFYFLVKAG